MIFDGRFEYIKWFWDAPDDDMPVLLFYEVDLGNERYATRMVEVFSDNTIHQVIEEGVDFVTEASVPTMEEINREPEFYAELISSDEFERVYEAKYYAGSISFPSQMKRKGEGA